MSLPKKPKTSPGVEARLRKVRNGPHHWVFRVRWTDPATGKRLSEEFATDSEAADFKAHLRLLNRRGNLHELDAGRETLTEFVNEMWWPDYAAGNLSRNTLKSYANVWNRHLLPRVGHLQLRQITPAVIDRLRADLERDKVGAPTIRRAMAILQGIFSKAIVWDRVKINPVAAVKKPAVRRKRAIEALPPATIEALRAHLRPGGRDAALVSVLAYAGLRPEEALALEWRHIRAGILLVEQKNIDGEIVTGQKTERPPRTVRLLAALQDDLDEYRIAQGRPRPRTLVFPRPDGTPWTESDYRNWRRRTWQPAATVVGIGKLTATTKTVTVDGAKRRRSNSKYVGATPYALRHSYASLRLHEGELSPIELAAEMGHSPAVLLGTYAHVMEELRDQPKIGANEAILMARRPHYAPTSTEVKQ